MRCLILVIVAATVLVNSKLSGQRELRNLSMLPDSIYQKEEVILRIQKETVILVNSSSDTVYVYANTGLLWYDTYATDGNGKWRPIDNRGGYCGVGFGYCSIPPRQFSWGPGIERQLGTRYTSPQKGIESKVRVCMDIQDGDKICSKPKELKIERWRFLPSHLYIYEMNKKALTASGFAERYSDTTNYENQIALFFREYGL